MVDTILVSIAVTAGIVALAGVPFRCWQFHTRRLHATIPRHAVARVTFSFFATLILVPNILAWIYALYVAYMDFTCVADCGRTGTKSAIVVGMLGCAYFLLEGFLFTARRRGNSAQVRRADRHPG